MGLHFRKSVKVAPGVRVNFSKKGVGMSVGAKGVRYSVGPSGRRKKSGVLGVVAFWLFIGWWWYIVRFCLYDFPKFLIKKLVQLVKYLFRQYKARRAGS